MTALTDFHNACADALIEKQLPALNYAVGYLQAGLMMRHPEACQVQCLYILENIKYWRGRTSQRVRPIFKHLAKPEAWK